MSKIKKKKKSNFSVAAVYFITIFVFLLILSFVAYFILSQFVFPKVLDKDDKNIKGLEYAPNKEDARTILFVGQDDNVLNLLMLVRIQPVTCEVLCVPVPINTIAKINTKETTLKNFYEKDGLTALCTAVENSFGTPVERYMVVDKNNFNDIVKAMGGISFPLPFDMNYENKSTGEITDLKSKDTNVVYFGDDLRKIMTYPLSQDMQDFTVNASGSIIAKLINETAKNKHTVINNLDSLFETLLNSAQTNISKSDFDLAKKDIIYILNKNANPASYDVPSGKWNKDGTFVLSSIFKAELKQYFNLVG